MRLHGIGSELCVLGFLGIMTPTISTAVKVGNACKLRLYGIDSELCVLGLILDRTPSIGIAVKAGNACKLRLHGMSSELQSLASSWRPLQAVNCCQGRECLQADTAWHE